MGRSGRDEEQQLAREASWDPWMMKDALVGW